MASNLLFGFVLISTWLLSTSARLCPRIFFQNINEKIVPYKMIEGVYIHKDGDYYNNFPVYRRENVNDLGLYYKTDKNGDKLLAFGDDRGGFIQDFGLAARLSRDPSSWLMAPLDRNDVFGRLVYQWQYYNIRDHTNYNVPVNASSPMIKAVCVDEDFRECNSDRVYFNERLNNKSGNSWNDPTKDYFYRVEGLFRDLRPVFKHSAMPELYLQYVDGYWVVTSSYRPRNSDENAILRVKDFAQRPEYITNTWSQWSHGWRDIPSLILRVFCRGVTSMSNICRSWPCDGSARCIYTSGNETLCLCTPGYTGLRCSVNKQCPTRYPVPGTERNFKKLGNRPGDLGMAFCSGLYPSIRYYLCVNGNSGPYWRGQESSACTIKDSSSTATPAPTQDLWRLRTTTTPKSKPINFDDYDFVMPLVMSVAIPLQLLLPFVFYCYAFCKRRCKELKDDQRRLEQGRVEGGLGRRQEGVATSVGQAEQGDRRHRQAVQEHQVMYRSRNPSLSRLISMHMYFSFYLWLTYLVGCDVCHCTMYGEVFYMLKIFAIVMVCLCPAIILLESFFCHELDYLRNIIEDESASEYIERLREVPPKIIITVECYHLETDTRVVHYRDASGNRYSSSEPIYSNRRIVTFVDREEFSFGSWVDVSNREMPALGNATLTRFDIDSSIQFGDQETADAFNWQMAEMVRRNFSRDALTNFSSTKEIPGLKNRTCAYVDLGVKPFWIRPRFFWIASLLQMTWPYRWLFRVKTAKNHFVVKKMVYKSATPPTEVDPNAAGYASSVVNNTGPSNICPGYPMSDMNILGTGHPPVNPCLELADLAKSISRFYSLNAGALPSSYPVVPHPNAPLPSYVTRMMDTAQDNSEPNPPLSTYSGAEFSPCTAGSVPNEPPPSYEASVSQTTRNK